MRGKGGWGGRGGVKNNCSIPKEKQRRRYEYGQSSSTEGALSTVAGGKNARFSIHITEQYKIVGSQMFEGEGGAFERAR